ncbi:MAG: efflux RND transporter periplasmic adaptor subunit [Deltaproteobacteria bacterium]|nr:efflux RND transporter periplasmic adaptor subunit [Deltaproteobacteria bacterium]
MKRYFGLLIIPIAGLIIFFGLQMAPLSGISCLVNAETDHKASPVAYEHEDHADHSDDEDGHEGHRHKGEKEHKDEDDDHNADAAYHDEHDEHDENLISQKAGTDLESIGIKIDAAQKGSIKHQIKLTGKISFNEDRISHLVPRIAGVVATVRKKLGDPVKKDEVLAELDSRDLADIKSDYLTARGNLGLAQITFQRKKNLWEQKIIAEQDFLEAKQIYNAAQIQLDATERKLHALGFSHDYIEKLPEFSYESLTTYRITAPFDGTIIEKHIVEGELAEEDTEVFVIADLSMVWAKLDVHPKHLPNIRKGQTVEISVIDGNCDDVESRIFYLSPTIETGKRTALALAEIANPDCSWRPGMFITALVTTGEEAVDAVVVSKDAVQTVENISSVFVVTDEGYRPEPVTLGRSNHKSVEILSGLSVGEKYVSKGAFELKAQLVTSSMSGHAGHGH